MATTKKAGRAPVQAAALPAEKLAPLFEPFAWAQLSSHQATISEAAAVDSFSLTRDIANGTELVLQIIERDLIDAEMFDGVRPLLSEGHRGTLMRFAIASMRALSNDAEVQLDRINKRQQEARKAAEGRPS